MPGCTLNCTDQQPRVHGEGFTQKADFQKDRKKNNASILYHMYVCACVCACVQMQMFINLYSIIYIQWFSMALNSKRNCNIVIC